MNEPKQKSRKVANKLLIDIINRLDELYPSYPVNKIDILFSIMEELKIEYEVMLAEIAEKIYSINKIDLLSYIKLDTLLYIIEFMKGFFSCIFHKYHSDRYGIH